MGHGDTSRIYRPKVVEAVQGMLMQKIQAGSQVSLALTTCGHVSIRNYISIRALCCEDVMITNLNSKHVGFMHATVS